MNKPLLAASMLALGATAFAQNAITLPQGYLSTEGPGFARAFGQWSTMRQQIAEGDLRGKSLILTGVNYRHDYQSHTASTGMGRTFSNVSLKLSDTDYSTFGATFSSNVKGVANQVFNSKVSWPTITGNPVTKPALWGGLKGDFKFPFIGTWMYSGKNDLLFDWQFSGGVLANAGAWSGAATVEYYLDGVPLIDYTGYTSWAYYPSSRPPCSDSGFSVGAFAGIVAFFYNKDYPTVAWQNQLRVDLSSSNTARSQPVVLALGFAANVSGVDVGARCNRLYVDISKGWIPLFAQANASGSWKQQWLVNSSPTLTGIKLYLQAAWNDSQTKAFSLSQARMTETPRTLPPASTPKRKCYINYIPNSTTGFVANTFYYMPLHHITYR
ncbi:MAG: hypothetical protein ACYTGW_07055 [Planctomycetota bacterium]|jgi:hypothetical protein